jgi:hypothetical protein
VISSEDRRPEPEPPPECPKTDSQPSHHDRGGDTTTPARIAEVLARWFTKNDESYTEYESWLQGRFGYWVRQLRNRVPDPQGELLSALGTRLEALSKPFNRGYIEQVLRNAFLDILKRERGAGVTHETVEYREDLTDISTDEGPPQLRRLEILQRLEELLELSPRCVEALTLRAQGFSDEVACKQSRWPCSSATFRRRVHYAHIRLRTLRRE